MRSVRYPMNGDDGELRLVINNYVVAYAERFAAVLTETLKEMRFKDQRWEMPDNYDAKLMLRNLSTPDPDIVRRIVSEVSAGKPLDFVFKGYYLSKDEFRYPISFHRLLPINGNLDDCLSGYITEWEFKVTYIDDSLISEFKKSY